MPSPRGSGDNGRLSQESHPARGTFITSAVVRAKAIRGLDMMTSEFLHGRTCHYAEHIWGIVA